MASREVHLHVSAQENILRYDASRDSKKRIKVSWVQAYHLEEVFSHLSGSQANRLSVSANVKCLPHNEIWHNLKYVKSYDLEP